MYIHIYIYTYTCTYQGHGRGGRGGSAGGAPVAAHAGGGGGDGGADCLGSVFVSIMNSLSPSAPFLLFPFVLSFFVFWSSAMPRPFVLCCFFEADKRESHLLLLRSADGLFSCLVVYCCCCRRRRRCCCHVRRTTACSRSAPRVLRDTPSSARRLRPAPLEFCEELYYLMILYLIL